MHRLRSARFLARLVLAWFALSVGAAIASPAVQPDAFQLVCSGGVMKLLAQADDDGATTVGLTLDCPLCATAVPPPVTLQLPAVQPLAHATAPLPAARLAALTGAPLPARGPPLHA